LTKLQENVSLKKKKKRKKERKKENNSNQTQHRLIDQKRAVGQAQ